jgi:hypothetical protein
MKKACHQKNNKNPTYLPTYQMVIYKYLWVFKYISIYKYIIYSMGFRTREKIQRMDKQCVHIDYIVM